MVPTHSKVNSVWVVPKRIKGLQVINSSPHSILDYKTEQAALMTLKTDDLENSLVRKATQNEKCNFKLICHTRKTEKTFENIDYWLAFNYNLTREEVMRYFSLVTAK